MRPLSLVLLAGCGRLGFPPAPAPDGLPDLTLRVSITDDRLAGSTTMASRAELPAGTIGLSLREALVIAANNPGPDRVTFDPSAFAAGTPAMIAVGAPLEVA